MGHAEKIDAQGGIAIPVAMRTSLRPQAGDTLFVCLDEETAAVHLAKAHNPFDLPFVPTMREYRAGRTTSPREFLNGEIDEPDGDNE